MPPIEEDTVFLASQCYSESLHYFEDAVKCIQNVSTTQSKPDCIRLLLEKHHDFIQMCHNNGLSR